MDIINNFTPQDAMAFSEIVRNIANQQINKMNIDYSYFGVISADVGNNTYDVSVPSENMIYPSIRNKSTSTLSIGDAVIVHAKNNNFGNAYILVKCGYTPVPSGGGSGETYVLPVATLAALGGIKSGMDITVGTDGLVSVNDNSHNHIIGNITGLQSILNDLSAKSIPSGGTTGQVLAKKSGTNYDVEWVNQSGGGGTSENGFGIITDGSGQVVSTTPNDTLKLVAGNNVTLNYDGSDKKITINSTGGGSGAIYWNYDVSILEWNS